MPFPDLAYHVFFLHCLFTHPGRGLCHATGSSGSTC
jgi:hypothetical protein